MTTYPLSGSGRRSTPRRSAPIARAASMASAPSRSDGCACHRPGAESFVRAPFAGRCLAPFRTDDTFPRDDHAEVVAERRHEFLDQHAVAAKPASVANRRQAPLELVRTAAQHHVSPPAAEPRLEHEGEIERPNLVEALRWRVRGWGMPASVRRSAVSRLSWAATSAAGRFSSRTPRRPSAVISTIPASTRSRVGEHVKTRQRDIPGPEPATRLGRTKQLRSNPQPPPSVDQGLVRRERLPRHHSYDPVFSCHRCKSPRSELAPHRCELAIGMWICRTAPGQPRSACCVSAVDARGPLASAFNMARRRAPRHDRAALRAVRRRPWADP